MPKLQGPLFSLTASNSLGGLIEYRNHGRQQVAQALRPQQKIRTERQGKQRTKFTQAHAAFTALAPTERAQWATLAARQSLLPFNVFLREYCAQQVIDGSAPQIPA